jgi:hypothetical protein
MNTNPYTGECRSPICMPLPSPVSRTQDPAKTTHGRSMPQSYSEPTLHGLDGQEGAKSGNYHVPIQLSQRSTAQSPSSSSGAASQGPRGRSVRRPSSPLKSLQDVNENDVLDVQEISRKRSRSPVKRILGLVKSTSLKDVASEPHAPAIGEPADKSKRTGLKAWGGKFKHGFLVCLVCVHNFWCLFTNLMKGFGCQTGTYPRSRRG